MFFPYASATTAGNRIVIFVTSLTYAGAPFQALPLPVAQNPTTSYTNNYEKKTLLLDIGGNSLDAHSGAGPA